VACDQAVADARERYRGAYAKATWTATPSRYPQVLCACAYAKHNEGEVFRATDVVDALRLVFKVDVKVQAVVSPLGKFCTKERGEVLKAISVSGRNQYMLADPMMRPFLRMKTGQILRE